MAGRLPGRRVVVLVEEGFEDLEFWVTVMRLRRRTPRSRSRGATRARVHGKHGLEATADVPVGALDPAEIDAMVVPGGWAPDKLRRLRERARPHAADPRGRQDRRH